jgi:hypothetical protein
MTVAVCLRCGALKHGAFNPCPDCRHSPDDDEDLTKHLLITDHFLSRTQLEAVSKQVKAGEPVEFPPELLQASWVTREQLDKVLRRGRAGKSVESPPDVLEAAPVSEQRGDREEKRSGRGCLIGLVVLVLLLGVALVVPGIWRSLLA